MTLNQNIKLLLLLILVQIACSQAKLNSVCLCNFYVTWENRGTQTDFTVTTSLDSTLSLNNAWFAIGFNKDPVMDGSNAVVCKMANGNPSVQHYVNIGYYSNLMDSNEPSVGLTNRRMITTQRNLTCMFTRENVNPRQRNYFNLSPSTPFRMLGAYGPLLDAQSGAIQFHGKNKCVSGQLVFDEPTVTTPAPHPSSTPSTFGHSSTTTAPTHPPTTTTTTTTTTSTTTITHPTTTKTQCVQCLCQYENGLFSLSWTETKDAVNFVFKTTALQKENIWSAFSFSSDDQMGQDDVHLCKAATNLKTVEHYYNNNQEPPTILVPSNPTIGLSNIQVSLNDNVLTCNFTRLKSLSHIQNYFDMKNPYYLLFSTGPLDQLANPCRATVKANSPCLINFLAPQTTTTTTTTTSTSTTTSTTTTVTHPTTTAAHPTTSGHPTTTTTPICFSDIFSIFKNNLIGFLNRLKEICANSKK